MPGGAELWPGFALHGGQLWDQGLGRDDRRRCRQPARGHIGRTVDRHRGGANRQLAGFADARCGRVRGADSGVDGAAVWAAARGGRSVAMEFWSTILLSATIAAIAAMGLFLQIRNGQMNVGMAVFSGIGGYVSGWLSTR